VATVREFMAGKMRGTSLLLQIDSDSSDDGAFALDRWQGVDLDVDFGTDTLNMFSQDHCPGAVQYWTAPAVAIIPITMDGNHVIVPVTLDGNEEQAVIDTGAFSTILDQPEAESAFHLTPGDSDTPDIGELNHVASARAFSHQFKSLSFGDVAVNNPKITILQHSPGVHVPMTAWRDDSPLRKEKLLIGMDVLRKLHVYFAFGEKKMYISAASVPTPEYLAQATEQFKALMKTHYDAGVATIDAMPADRLKIRYENSAEARIDDLTKQLISHPDDPSALGSLCFTKATLNKDLDAALRACDQAIKLRPDSTDYPTSRGLVLYQQGRYQDALESFNAALAINPKLAQTLRLRGATKGKLGDASGRDADIAAAKALNDKVEILFKPYNVEL
jgi:hypothetical protein